MIDLIVASDGMGGGERLIKILQRELSSKKILNNIHILKKDGYHRGFVDNAIFYSKYFKIGIFFSIFSMAINFFKIRNSKISNIGCTEGWPHLVAYFRSKITGGKCILWVQSDVNYISKLYWNVFENILFKYVMTRADVIIAVSESVKRDVKLFIGDDPIKNCINLNVKVIDVCVGDVFFESSCKSNNKNESILFVGRLEPIKNVRLLFDSISLLRHIDSLHVDIVGDGSQLEMLKSYARDINLNNLITFAGAKDDVHIYMMNGKCLALPSFSEGFGLVVVEALLCGMTVVLTPFKGAENFSKISKNVYLSASFDVNDFAECLKIALRNGYIDESKEIYRKWSEASFLKSWLVELEELGVGCSY